MRMKKCFPSASACHGGFSIQLLKHTLKGRSSLPRSLGGWRRSAPRCSSAPAEADAILQPGTTSQGRFFIIYRWILELGPPVCSAVCSCFLHLGFLQLMLKRTLTLNQWIYGHGIFLTGFFYLPCIVFILCSEAFTDEDGWDIVYTHSLSSHF